MVYRFSVGNADRFLTKYGFGVGADRGVDQEGFEWDFAVAEAYEIVLDQFVVLFVGRFFRGVVVGHEE